MSKSCVAVKMDTYIIFCAAMVTQFLQDMVTCDYSCVCNYNVELTVYDSTSDKSTIIGYLYEFDCKPHVSIDKLNTHWFPIAYEKQLGYVKKDAQIQIQTCPGNEPVEDRLTTTLVTSTVASTTKVQMATNVTAPTLTTTPTPMSTTHSLKSQTPSPMSKLTTKMFVSSSSLPLNSLTPFKMASSITRTTALSPSLQYTVPNSKSPSTQRIGPAESTSKLHLAFSTFLTSSAKSTTRIQQATSISSLNSTVSASSETSTRRPSTYTSMSGTINPTTFSTVGVRTSIVNVITKEATASKPVSNFSFTTGTVFSMSSRFTTDHTSDVATSTFRALTVPSSSGFKPTTHVQFDESVLKGDIRACDHHGIPGHLSTRFGKHCYELVTGANRSWALAELYCKMNGGGNLLSIISDAEEEYVYQLLKWQNITESVWIGLNDRNSENTFQWSSGEPFIYSNAKWNDGTKGQNSEKANCVILQTVQYPGLWETADCHIPHAFICKYNARSIQDVLIG